MSRVRFIAAARREFLAQVIYYNEEEPGLGARFTEAVEDASARALAFPLAGSSATENTRRVLLKDFPFALCIGQTRMASPYLRSRITHVVRAIGSRVCKIASAGGRC